MNEAALAIAERLPPGWALTTLGEAFDWGSGGTPRSDVSSYYGGEIPWLIIGDLNDGVVNSSAHHITEEGYNNSSAKWVQPGSVLLAMYGSIGKLGLAAVPLTTNQAIAFTSSSQIVNRYLFWFLRFRREELNSLGKGGTQRNISQTVIKSIKFPVAPHLEQYRIVAEIEKQVTRLDAAIAALKRARVNLKRYRAVVLKAACEGRLVPTEAALAHAEGREYETAGALLARTLTERRAKWEADQLTKMSTAGTPPKGTAWRAKYVEPVPPKEDELPPLPEGWVWACIGQAFRVSIGATPSRGRPDYWDGDIPWVSSGEVAFRPIFESRECMTVEGLRNTSTELHPPGTVLLGMIGEGKTRGQAAILKISACNNQNSAAIEVSEAGLSPEYIYRFFEKQYQETRRISSGNNQPALNKSRVEDIAFPLPPLAEQHRIAAEAERRLSVVDHLASIAERSLVRGERLRQAILRLAFEGRLVLQSPDDEPAAHLLERIHAERATDPEARPRARRTTGRVQASAQVWLKGSAE